MASKKHETGLLVAIAAFMILIRMSTAQSNCSRALMGLSSCVNYVTGNISTPSSSCCTSLAGVVQSQPQCLCPLLNNSVGASLGIAINQTLALGLPNVCNVQTPPISQCNAVANGPTGAPGPAPVAPTTDDASEPPESPAVEDAPAVPSGTGSKTVPRTSGSTSRGSTLAISSVFLRVVTLFIAPWIANTFSF